MPELLDQLGDDRGLVQVAFITVDSEQDTPEMPRNHARNLRDNFIELSGDVAAIRRAAKAFKVFFQKVRLAGGDLREGS
jgi:protein SCO1